MNIYSYSDFRQEWENDNSQVLLYVEQELGMLPIAIRIGLAIDIILNVVRLFMPDYIHILPLGGSEFVQISAIALMTIACTEIYDCIFGKGKTKD